MINEAKMDGILLELGFGEFGKGTTQLRTAVRCFNPDKKMGTLYAEVAAAHGTTPARAERAMRHSIECAFQRSDWETQFRYFGNSLNPNTMKPTNSEFIARMARVCNED